MDNNSNHMGTYKYNRVVGNYGFRGFKLNIRRFSIQKLRFKFLSLLRRWKNTYRSAVRFLKLTRSRGKKKNSAKIVYNLINGGEGDCRLMRPPLLNRSNSFYSEAIADCLEFIKRNSLDHHEIQDHDPIGVALR